MDEAHHIWWITSVLDTFRKQKINPLTISNQHRIGDELLVPNPLRFPAQERYFPAAQRAQKAGLSAEHKDWLVTYVDLIHDLIVTIDHYLEINTFVKNEVHPEIICRGKQNVTATAEEINQIFRNLRLSCEFPQSLNLVI